MAKHEEFSDSKTQNALAIFCRAPRLGTVKTRLAQTHGEAFAWGLYRAMLTDSFDLGRALAPAVETFACFTPADAFEGQNSLAFEGQTSLRELWQGPKIAQCEGDLGARMLDCFAQLRAQGFQKVVLIGADSPDLPLMRLQRAFEKLQQFDLVIGETSDGGFHLIGASVSVPKALFEGVVWSSETVMSRVFANFHQLVAPKHGLTLDTLAGWRDVDDANDLIELRRRLFELGTHAPQTRAFLEFHAETGRRGEF